MSSETLIYIILSGIIALLVALFQYVHKSKKRSSTYTILTFLRFLSIFALLLLLINPKYEKTIYYSEKPNLILAVDNSESIAYLDQDEAVNTLFTQLKNDKQLNDKFNLETYAFDGDFEVLNDSLGFSGTQTNITRALGKLNEVYKNTVAPTVLLTDGNQTYGPDYQYAASTYKQPVYPVVFGDTLTFADLKIQQLNVNKYAYLKNRFPVEAIVTYNGSENLQSRFKIIDGNTTIFSKLLDFSQSKASHIVKTTLLANRVGVQSYRAIIEPISDEKNKVNNTKNFAVEVIDQKTNIAIVSEIKHPDIGALKKGIERNDQRSVSILSPNDFLNQINDFQMVMLYQPNGRFRLVYEAIERFGLNVFTISGTQTQWSAVNTYQSVLKQKITNQVEEFQPVFNPAYSTFIIDDFDFEDFPPLKTEFGATEIWVPNNTLAFKSVNGVVTQEPLLSTFEMNGRRFAFLNGEGVWRWRQQSYLDTKSFESFDGFLGKLVQYLSSNQRKKRLNVSYESFYDGSDNIKLQAQFFNKNYEFDASAILNLYLENTDTKATQTIPFVLKNNFFEVDLSDIAPGTYNFTVKHTTENISTSGTFEVLEYNIEQQFYNANDDKLMALATSSNGKQYYSDQATNLVSDLVNDERFATIQKRNKKIVPLIGWTILLGLIVLSLALEWFIRKYNGLT